MSLNLDHLISSLLFINQITTVNSPVIYVGWTLEWEVYFYIIFAIAIYLGFKGFVKILLVTILLSLLAGAFYKFQILEFVFGILIARLYSFTTANRKGFILSKRTQSYFGIFCFAFGFLLLSVWFMNQEYLTNVDRLFLWGVPSFFIVLGSLYSPEIKSKIIYLLGDASYSIYLIQVTSLPLFYKILKFIDPTMQFDLIIFLSLVFTTFTGVMCYLLIEKPMTLHLKRL